MSVDDPGIGRVLLEVCRHTYAVGAGGAGNVPDQRDAEQHIARLAPGSALGCLQATSAFRGVGDSATSKASVLQFERANVVSFMGTEAEFSLHDLEAIKRSLRDWLQDARAKPVSFVVPAAVTGGSALTLPGLVHVGFLSELLAVLGPVLQQLRGWGGFGKPVVITGHSQGAAEAGLAVSVLSKLGFSVQSVWTFAAPRAGNADFVQATESLGVPIHRLEFGDDIVPHLPPVALKHKLQTMSVRWAALKMLLEAALRGLHDYGYATLGSLTYGHQSNQVVRCGISRSSEPALFEERLGLLMQSPSNWAAHHHLYGPESGQGKPRGGYTALVSPAECGWTLQQG